MGAVETLSSAQLNRATLARQLLLERHELTVSEAVSRVAGLQAQEPKPPFIGLWSRLADFDRSALTGALQERSVVRASAMRATLHLLSAEDYRAFRPPLAPVLAGALSALGDRAAGLDTEAVQHVARELLVERPRTFGEIRAALVERFPEVDERALGFTVRMLLELVMVPTEDRWAFPRDALFALSDAWLGEPPPGRAEPDGLVFAYLRAFGPATVADAQTWSGVKALKPVFERLRPQLAVFADERGRELFDLPNAPRPDPDTPAPLRYLPEFDNLVLAHADRTRLIADVHRPLVTTRNLRVRATFLLDGRVAGTWTMVSKRKVATLEIAPFTALALREVLALEEEAERLVSFLEPGSAGWTMTIAHPAGG